MVVRAVLLAFGTAGLSHLDCHLLTSGSSGSTLANCKPGFLPCLEWYCDHCVSGVSLDLAAHLAEAFPGHVANLISCSHLLAVCHDSSDWTGNQLKGLQLVQRASEGSMGQYPVTLAFLKLTNTLVTAGINQPCVRVSSSPSCVRELADDVGVRNSKS